MEFRTTSTLDVAFLHVKGHPVKTLSRLGSLVAFTVGIEEADAEQLLANNPEYRLCLDFFRAWSHLRRNKDRIKRQQP